MLAESGRVKRRKGREGEEGRVEKEEDLLFAFACVCLCDKRICED